MSRHNVVVASADGDVCTQLRMVLRGERYAVATVADMDAALIEIALAVPEVLVLDAELPGGGGAMALARILRAQPETAGVRTLLLERTATTEAGLPDGVDARVTLPVTALTLLRHVESLCAGG